MVKKSLKSRSSGQRQKAALGTVRAGGGGTIRRRRAFRKKYGRKRFVKRRGYKKGYKRMDRLKVAMDPSRYFIKSAMTTTEDVALPGEVRAYNAYVAGCYYENATIQLDPCMLPFTRTGDIYESDISAIINATAGGDVTPQTTPQSINVKYIQHKIHLRNNGNVAANLRLVYYKPRKSMPFSVAGNTMVGGLDFPNLWYESLAVENIYGPAGSSAYAVNPNITPYDLQNFTKKAKVWKIKKVRLLPGESIVINKTVFKNRHTKTDIVTPTVYDPRWTRFCGYLLYGDPVHKVTSDGANPPVYTITKDVTTAPAKIDKVVEIKVKWKSILSQAPTAPTLIMQRTNIPTVTSAQAGFTSAFANEESRFEQMAP